MLLSAINFSDLVSVPFELAWGANNIELDRKFYRSRGLFYKIWGPKFHVIDYVLIDGVFVEHKYATAQSGLAAIDVGLICDETCPGFVDLIWDENRRCRGYVMREGVQFRSFDEVDPSFIETVCERSRIAGYASTDFCPKNTVQIDGHPSLIDIDTVPTRLNSLNIEIEKISGCLRSHIFPVYRKYIIENFGQP